MRSAPIVGTKAGTWAMFAVNYALGADSAYVGVGYMKPPYSHQRPHWIVQLLSSRADLDNWYQDLVGTPEHYHYLAAFDKTVPAWNDGKPVAAASGDPDVHVGATPSVRDQLAHLDRLVAAHENYWVSVAERNPHSSVVIDFLRRYWDPWFGAWMHARSHLDRQRMVVDAQGYSHEEPVPARTDEVSALVHEAAKGLSGLREFAAQSGIPTPDLGTSRHGFVSPEPPNVASHEGGPPMSAHSGWDHVGADKSYREIAIEAVRSSPSASAYGYLRSGIRQKVYLFPSIDDARDWYATAPHEPYDYRAVFSSSDFRSPVAEDFGGRKVVGIGADKSYREVASQAVRNSPPSSAYGYLRTGLHQRVYLFGSVDDASAWFGQEHDRARVSLEPVYDYLAIFASSDLRTPVAEDIGSAGTVSSGDPAVGHWLLPLALGLPAGALGGYYYRKWQETHPGKILPWVSGDADVGCDPSVGAYPWYDIYEPGPMILRNGPALDFVGADTDAARRRAWPRTKALIQSAIHETALQSHLSPEHVFVWSLESTGDTQVVPFSSYDQALDYMRDRIHTDHVALALFDQTSPHWPNPVNWTKNDDPAYEAVIADQIARHGAGPGRGMESVSARMSREAAEAAHAESISARMSREAAARATSSGVVGAWPWVDVVGLEVVGQAIDTLRRQAGVLAQEVASPLVLVLRDGRNRWQYGKFRSPGEAIDRFARMTSDPDLFVYAALFDKSDPRFPEPIDETIGAATPSATGAQPTIQRLLPKAA